MLSTPPGGVLLDTLNGFQDVPKTDAVVPHRGTASARTRSRTRTRSPLSVTTSTGAPKASWRSISRPPRSESDRPGSRSTRKSTSLWGSLSPRATEPNTRTLYAPCLAASPRTEARLVARSSCKVIPPPFSHFSGRPEIAIVGHGLRAPFYSGHGINDSRSRHPRIEVRN